MSNKQAVVSHNQILRRLQKITTFIGDLNYALARAEIRGDTDQIRRLSVESQKLHATAAELRQRLKKPPRSAS